MDYNLKFLFPRIFFKNRLRKTSLTLFLSCGNQSYVDLIIFTTFACKRERNARKRKK